MTRSNRVSGVHRAVRTEPSRLAEDVAEVLAGARCLLVEDEEWLALGYARLLQRRGVLVLGATDVPTALDDIALDDLQFGAERAWGVGEKRICRPRDASKVDG